jgi:hypothetical protein
MSKNLLKKMSGAVWLLPVLLFVYEGQQRLSHIEERKHFLRVAKEVFISRGDLYKVRSWVLSLLMLYRTFTAIS